MRNFFPITLMNNKIYFCSERHSMFWNIIYLVVRHQDCSIIAIELWFRVTIQSLYCQAIFTTTRMCQLPLTQVWQNSGYFFFPTCLFYFQTTFFWTLYYHFFYTFARLYKCTIAHFPKAYNEYLQPFVATWFDML